MPADAPISPRRKQRFRRKNQRCPFDAGEDRRHGLLPKAQDQRQEDFPPSRPLFDLKFPEKGLRREGPVLREERRASLFLLQGARTRKDRIDDPEEVHGAQGVACRGPACRRPGFRSQVEGRQDAIQQIEIPRVGQPRDRLFQRGEEVEEIRVPFLRKQQLHQDGQAPPPDRLFGEQGANSRPGATLRTSFPREVERLSRKAAWSSSTGDFSSRSSRRCSIVSHVFAAKYFFSRRFSPSPRAKERKERSPDIPFGGDDLEDPEEPLPPFFLEGKKGRQQLEELPVGISFGQGAGDREGGFRNGTLRFGPRGSDPFHEKAEEIFSPLLRERLEGKPEPPEHLPQNVGRDEPGRPIGGGRGRRLARTGRHGAFHDQRKQFRKLRELLHDLPLVVFGREMGREECPPERFLPRFGPRRRLRRKDPPGEDLLVVHGGEADPADPLPEQVLLGGVVDLSGTQVVKAPEKDGELPRRDILRDPQRRDVPAVEHLREVRNQGMVTPKKRSRKSTRSRAMPRRSIPEGSRRASPERDPRSASIRPARIGCRGAYKPVQ